MKHKLLPMLIASTLTVGLCTTTTPAYAKKEDSGENDITIIKTNDLGACQNNIIPDIMLRTADNKRLAAVNPNDPNTKTLTEYKKELDNYLYSLPNAQRQDVIDYLHIPSVVIKETSLGVQIETKPSYDGKIITLEQNQSVTISGITQTTGFTNNIDPNRGIDTTFTNMNPTPVKIELVDDETRHYDIDNYLNQRIHTFNTSTLNEYLRVDPLITLKIYEDGQNTDVEIKTEFSYADNNQPLPSDIIGYTSIRTQDYVYLTSENLFLAIVKPSRTDLIGDRLIEYLVTPDQDKNEKLIDDYVGVFWKGNSFLFSSPIINDYESNDFFFNTMPLEKDKCKIIPDEGDTVEEPNEPPVIEGDTVEEPNEPPVIEKNTPKNVGKKINSDTDKIQLPDTGINMTILSTLGISVLSIGIILTLISRKLNKMK